MSRKHQSQPQQSTAVPPAPPAPPTVEPTCGDCKHWKRQNADLGECRESPPCIFVETGPIVVYGRVRASNPACSRIALK